MAVQFVTEVTIAAPPERVFAAVTDIDDWKNWMPNLVSVEKLTDGEFGVGTEWEETRKMFGKAATEVFEVTKIEAPSSLSLRVDGCKGSSKKGEYRFDYEFAPGRAGTTVRMAGVIDVPGFFAKLMGKLMVGTFKKICDKDLAALRTHIESAG